MGPSRPVIGPASIWGRALGFRRPSSIKERNNGRLDLPGGIHGGAVAHLLRLIALWLALFSTSAYAQQAYFSTQAQATAACQSSLAYQQANTPNPPAYEHLCDNSANTAAHAGYIGVVFWQHNDQYAEFWYQTATTLKTPAQCASDTSVAKIPVPGPTPASMCTADGCTISAEFPMPGVGPYCDASGANCFLRYTTAGAAANAALTPGDGRFAATCTPGTVPGATGTDTNGDGVPNTTDPTSKDSDGDGTPDSKDPFPTDATNGKDNGTGNEADNTSSGGGDCATAPVSKGDGIAAQIAYQTWRTRCAVELLNASTQAQTKTIIVSGGGGLTTAQASDLAGTKANTAAAAAAAASIDGKMTDTGTAAANVTGVAADASRGTHGAETTYGASGLDVSGMGAGNTCPTMGTLNILGRSITPDTSLMCTWATVIGQLVLVFAALGCLRILGSAA